MRDGKCFRLARPFPNSSDVIDKTYFILNLVCFLGKVFYFDLEIESDRNLRQVYEWGVIANVVRRSVSKYKRLLASDNLFFCNSCLWRLEKKLIALGFCPQFLSLRSVQKARRGNLLAMTTCQQMAASS